MPHQIPDSVYIEAAWDEFEEAFLPYWSKLNDCSLNEAVQIPSEEEAARLLPEVFQLFEKYLDRKDIFFGTQVFTSAANILSLKICKPQVWAWLRKCAGRYSDERFQEALCIAALIPAAEEPTYPEDIPELMEFLRDPATAWGVFCAYNFEGRKKLFRDYQWYVDRCRSRGETPLELSQEMLDEWIEEGS